MKAFLRGLSAVALVNVVSGVLGIVVVPIAVRRLGIEGYGLYSMFSVLTGYLILVELGLGKNLVRRLGAAASEGETRRLLQLALGLYVTIAGVLVLLSPVILPAVTSLLFRVSAQHVATLRWITIVAIVDYLLSIPSSLRWNYALSQERVGDYARFMLQSNSARSLLMLAGVLLTVRVELAIAFVLGRRLIDLAVAPRILPALPEGSWRPRFEFNECRALLGQSSLLAMTQLLQLSSVAVGSVLVNLFFGLTALGTYRSTFDVVTKVWFFSITAQTVLYPRFIQLMKREESRLRLLRLLPGVQTASWLTYCILGVVGSVGSVFILRLIHLDGSTTPILFSLLLVGVLWNAHAILSGELLQARAAFRRVAEVAGVAFAVMTIVFLLLSRLMLTEAIGWAWMFSQFLSSALIDYYAVRGLGGEVRWPAIVRERLPAAAIVLSAIACRAHAPFLLVGILGLAGALYVTTQLRGMRNALLDLFGRRVLAEGV
ncbi:MAG: oligosaccharide flippase family protein [bacterium]